MAGSLNKMTLIGTLGKDPEVRTAQNGMKIVSLSVATEDSWKDKASGERKKLTEWHRVVIMNDGLATIAERYLKKGNRVYLAGKLQTRKWTDRDGHDKYTTEILLGAYNGELILLERNETAGGAQSTARSQSSASKPAEAQASDEDFDEIPF